MAELLSDVTPEISVDKKLSSKNYLGFNLSSKSVQLCCACGISKFHI